MRSCTLILLMLGGMASLAPVAGAQDEVFGSTNAMHGTVTSFGYRYDSPLRLEQKTARRTTVAHGKIEVRYRMWRLVGEPVFVFEPRYQLDPQKGIAWDWAHKILVRTSAPPRTVEATDVVNGTARYLTVSQDLWDLIRIRSFGMTFAVNTRTGIGGRPGVPVTVAIHQGLTAVMSGPEKWGWDVPGSPSWAKTFSSRGSPLKAKGTLGADEWLPKDKAERLWKLLWERWKTTKTAPLDSVAFSRVEFDFSRFFSEVEKILPGASDPLFRSPQRLGEPDEAFQERTALERQARAMLRGIDRELEWIQAGGGAAEPSAALTRRLALTERVLKLLPSDAPPDLVAQLARAKRHVASAAADARIRSLATKVGRWVSTNAPGEQLPADLAKEFDRLATLLDAPGVRFSSAVRERWERLARLRPNGWVFVFGSAGRAHDFMLFLWGGSVTKKQRAEIRAASVKARDAWLARSPRQLQTRIYRVPASLPGEKLQAWAKRTLLRPGPRRRRRTPNAARRSCRPRVRASAPYSSPAARSAMAVPTSLHLAALASPAMS
ncbi:MAG: hypothetical protein ACYTGX_12240 [Planctomycetota bacterium]|jgi:hypothetical protein